MSYDGNDRCPNCGRPLTLDSSGSIGYCTHHKKWFPVAAGSESDAAKKNSEEAQAAKQAILEEERIRQEKQRQEQFEQKRVNKRRLVLVFIAFFIVVASVIFFVVRPSLVYKSANLDIGNGDYESAHSKYRSLGDYKDSSIRLATCNLIIGMESGEIGDALNEIKAILSETPESIETVSSLLYPILLNWNSNRIKPETVIEVVEALSIFYIDENPYDDISVDAHVGLLRFPVVDYYLMDINADEEKELVVLDETLSVLVFRMSNEGNTQIPLSNDILADCYSEFGRRLEEQGNHEDCIRCFSSAYHLSPSAEKKNDLIEAYNRKCARLSDKGLFDEAAITAEEALSLFGTPEQFEIFYDLNYRRCTIGKDNSESIAMWLDFAEGSAAVLRKYGAEGRWRTDTGTLYLNRAIQYVNQHSEKCVDDLRSAFGYGAEIESVLANAIESFDYGLTRTKLQMLALEIADSEGDSKRESLSGELNRQLLKSLTEWKVLGIAASEVPVLIKIAAERGVVVLKDWMEEYRSASLQAVPNAVHTLFVDCDKNGYDCLFAVSADGLLNVYKIEDDCWKTVSGVQTNISDSRISIANTNPLILVVVSERKDAFCVLSHDGITRVLFEENEILNYGTSGSIITWSKELPGSILRLRNYSYNPASKTERPDVVSTDWQKNNYPQPEDAKETLIRYFEALYYGITDECGYLTSGSIDEVPAPDGYDTIVSSTYCVLDKEELFEFTYPSSGKSVRLWAELSNRDGWKITGFSSDFGTAASDNLIDYSLPLLPLNVETVGRIETTGSRMVYRLMIPQSGSISLLWQAGVKDLSRTAFAVDIYRDTTASNPVISYELQPSPSKQQSDPIFVSAGVYYVSVKATTGDAYEYHISIPYNPSRFVESEVNDTARQATHIVPNEWYQGSLLTSSDVDYWEFSLDKPTPVKLRMKTSGSGKRATAYSLSVSDKVSGVVVSSQSIAGDVSNSESANLYLSEGSYLVRIEKGSSWLGDSYSLCLSTLSVPEFEKEINNTPATANPVQVNKEIHGSFAVEGDVDCYSFTLGNDSAIKLKLTFLPTDTNSKTYVLTIIDSLKNELQKVNIGGKENAKDIPTVVLKKGNYIVKVENPRFVAQDYVLTIDSKDVGVGESEPNNASAKATVLKTNETVSGVLLTEEDVDYYRISVNEDSVLTLGFKFPPAASRLNAFSIGIEENGKTLLNLSAKGDSGGLEQKLQFPAGEYYIRIKAASEWLNCIYELSFVTE